MDSTPLNVRLKILLLQICDSDGDSFNPALLTDGDKEILNRFKEDDWPIVVKRLVGIVRAPKLGEIWKRRGPELLRRLGLDEQNYSIGA